jgi:DNA-binding NtrC family response regulator
MRRVRDLIQRLANSDASVLIQGETGTGKELVARALHKASPRAQGPFVAINCAAVPAALLESELFGHARGAFTDAKSDRPGLFVQASGGTLLLDEIGEMPLEMQAKLLRALQERVVRPVGGSREVPFDVRILAATHRDMEGLVAQRQFRQDLYYRLNVVRLDVPALRDRPGDILTLAVHFLDRFCERAGHARLSLSGPVAERLLAYDWPGNVRELENAMERIVALSRFDQTAVEDLPLALRSAPSQVTDSLESESDIVSLDELERRHIVRVLELARGNKSRAAELLGLDRRSLYRKISRSDTEPAEAPEEDVAELSAAVPVPESVPALTATAP